MTKKCVKDEENPVPKYLHRRDDGRSSNYYVRLTAPTAIQHLLSKKDYSFRCSTGTADLRHAKAIGAEIVAKKRREWHDLHELAARREVSVSTPLTKSLVQQICGARLNSWLHTDNQERYGNVGLDDELLREIETFCRLTDAGMRSVLAQGRSSSRWADVVEVVDDWARTLGYKLETTDPLFSELIRAFAQSEKSAHEFISARNNGEQPPELGLVSRTGTSLSAMNDEFIAYKSKLETLDTIPYSGVALRCGATVGHAPHRSPPPLCSATTCVGTLTSLSNSSGRRGGQMSVARSGMRWSP